jgi:hypothetical protein
LPSSFYRRADLRRLIAPDDLDRLNFVPSLGHNGAVGGLFEHSRRPITCGQLFQMAGWRNSFTEHFCYDEDDDGSDKASASEEI